MGWKGVWRWWGEEGDYTPIAIHRHHRNHYCIQMGSAESRFTLSLLVRDQSHNTVSTNHNLFEKKGEPKRIRTAVPVLTSLTPYRYLAKPAHLLPKPSQPLYFRPGLRTRADDDLQHVRNAVQRTVDLRTWPRASTARETKISGRCFFFTAENLLVLGPEQCKAGLVY